MLVALLAVIVGIVIFAPQLWTRRVFAQYSGPRPDYPGTGGELARHLLNRLDMAHITVGMTEKGDHYDPETKTVRLTPDHFSGKSLTAVTIAAHEVGHIVLHPDEKRLDFHRDLPIQGLEREVRDPIEKEADYFAACLLMPRAYVAQQFRARFLCDGQFIFDQNTAYMLRPYDVESLLYPRRPLQREIVLASAKTIAGRHFDSLAQVFRVSIETMAIRIKELRLVRT